MPRLNSPLGMSNPNGTILGLLKGGECNAVRLAKWKGRWRKAGYAKWCRAGAPGRTSAPPPYRSPRLRLGEFVIFSETGLHGGGGRYQIQMTINPLQSAHAAPRCKAKSKRTGKPCRAPAVRGCHVCRKHGARGGAPTGKQNGNYRHGTRTKKALQAVRLVNLLSRLARKS